MKPLILVVNDDGIASPGLLAVAEAADEFADLLIAAPFVQQTAMGRAFPNTADAGIIDTVELTVNGRKIAAYAVHGSPAMTVEHAVIELAQRKPDLCISGVNYGENLGMCMTASGTVGAAMEAFAHGLPAIAVSLETDIENQYKNTFKQLDFTQCKRMIREFAAKVLKEGMPEGVALYNINVPSEATKATPTEWTRMSQQLYFAYNAPAKRDFGMPYKIPMHKYVDYETLDDKSDIACIHKRRHISITPISWDMTAK